MVKIVSFTGAFKFLSNFYLCEIEYEGIVYPSSEHAYVAAKTTDIIQKYAIAEIDNPGEVKRLGRKLKIRSDWEVVKLLIMRSIVEAKFDQNPELMEMLQMTRPHELIEGNSWGDIYWGQSPVGKGKNELGKILMSIRDDISRLYS